MNVRAALRGRPSFGIVGSKGNTRPEEGRARRPARTFVSHSTLEAHTRLLTRRILLQSDHMIVALVNCIEQRLQPVVAGRGQGLDGVRHP